MSEILQKAAEILGARLSGVAGVVKVDIAGEGGVMVENGVARVGDGDADVVISADAATFSGLLDGSVDPTMAYMSGRLKVAGDTGLALQVASRLS